MHIFSGDDWDTVEGMSVPADQSKWKLDVVWPGRLAVTISYAFAAATGPRKVRIGSLRVAVAPTTGPAVFSKRAAGMQSLDITANNPQFGPNRIWLRRLDP